MTASHHPILQTLTEWSQLPVESLTEDDYTAKSDKSPVNADTVARIHRIATAKRGKAQQIPSSLLQPV